MHLKILRFSSFRWFENVRGCREAALHLFVKQMPPTDSWHELDSDRCNFHLLMPALTLVSLLRKDTVSGVGNCHAAWRHQKTTVCTSIVYGKFSDVATSITFSSKLRG
jgi:hypothetical protein